MDTFPARRAESPRAMSEPACTVTGAFLSEGELIAVCLIVGWAAGVQWMLWLRRRVAP